MSLCLGKHELSEKERECYDIIARMYKNSTETDPYKDKMVYNFNEEDKIELKKFTHDEILIAEKAFKTKECVELKFYKNEIVFYLYEDTYCDHCVIV